MIVTVEWEPGQSGCLRRVSRSVSTQDLPGTIPINAAAKSPVLSSAISHVNLLDEHISRLGLYHLRFESLALTGKSPMPSTRRKLGRASHRRS